MRKAHLQTITLTDPNTVKKSAHLLAIVLGLELLLPGLLASAPSGIEFRFITSM